MDGGREGGRGERGREGEGEIDRGMDIGIYGCMEEGRWEGEMDGCREGWID